MATALGTNFTVGINASMDSMDASINHISNFRAQVGSRMRVAEQFDVHLSDIEVSVVKDLSDIEDADILSAFSELQRSQQSYESAMQISVASRTRNIFELI